MTNETVGERIRTRRKELGMSVDTLAEKIGKNRATVYRYECGEIENVSIVTLRPLAKALQTSPAYLMGWDEDPDSDNRPYSPADLSFMISERIKYLRKKRKMTQQQLADKAGIPKEIIEQYEIGNIENISIEQIIDISVAFNQSPDFLLGFNSIDKPFKIKPASLPSNDGIINHYCKMLSDEGQKKVIDYAKLVYNSEKNQ